MLAKDSSFDGEDVYVQVSDLKARTSYTIDELAEDMRLDFAANGVLDHDKISFVSHSMGGLITRAYLIKYRDTVAKKVRSLHFFSTPTEGSPQAQLAKAVANSGNPQLGDMFPLQSDNYSGTPSEWLALDQFESKWNGSDALAIILRV